MALEDGDYGGAFGTSDFLSPAMGRIFAEEPESLIPHLIAAGITPEQFQKSLAENGAFPSQGVVGDQNIYAPPTGAPPSAEFPLIPGAEGIPSYNAPMQPPGTPSLAERVNEWGRTQVPGAGGAAAPMTPKAIPTERIGKPTTLQERFAPAEEHPLRQYVPVANPATPDTGEQPATPSAATPSDQASADKKKDEGEKTKRAVSALAGVKAPPAPPQPQLRPFAGERPGALPASPLIAMLSQILAGNPQAANSLRLGQAVRR